MADIEKIAEDLSNLTVLEAAELATLLEEKWGVSAAAAPMAVAMPAGGGDAGGGDGVSKIILFWQATNTIDGTLQGFKIEGFKIEGFK